MDIGETWQPPSNDLPGLDLHGFAVAPSNPNRLYAFDMQSSGLYRCVDGGVIWESRKLSSGTAMEMLPARERWSIHCRSTRASAAKLPRAWMLARPGKRGPFGTVTSLAIAPTYPSSDLRADTDQCLWRRKADGTWQLPVEPKCASWRLRRARLSLGGSSLSISRETSIVVMMAFRSGQASKED